MPTWPAGRKLTNDYEQSGLQFLFTKKLSNMINMSPQKYKYSFKNVVDHNTKVCLACIKSTATFGFNFPL